MYRYPNLIKLENVNLTDESRKFSQEREEKTTIVDLASGKKKKFVKGVIHRFTIDWENVALNAQNTVDGYGGRNEIKDFGDSIGPFTLVIEDGRNAEETYEVFVDGYNEELLMRRGEGDMFRYRVSLSLEEQG
jgi:hypothetical protein